MTPVPSDPTAGSAPRPADLGGFVRAEAGRLVDHRGREVRLRGVGLGNWLLPEGYMWRLGRGTDSPRRIEALIRRIAGDDYAEAFWPRYHDVYIAEADIARIAAVGFDHVRLPIAARLVQDADGAPIEAGYALIDRVVGWGRAHGIRVLLELHGAPGGQTGTNFDDSPHRRPELFTSERYRALTVRLWRDLAQRYAGETAVLGYDLLNEPLPKRSQRRHRDALRSIYLELTAAIRAVDRDHLLVYEGWQAATNPDLFDEVWDPNSLLQLHKYWTPPTRESIAGYLDARDRRGLPIYVGESGENGLEWIRSAFRLYEAEDIGWCFWPWKKLEAESAPVSVIAPDGWPAIVAASRWRRCVRRADAQRTLDELLERVRLEQARWQPEVVAAVMP